MNLVVAQRSSRCRICVRLVPEDIAKVNATIWPEPGVAARHRSYRVDAVRACAALGLEVEQKLVTRHAAHVERSWHRVTGKGQSRVAPGEILVVASDYQSVAARAARLGMVAMDRIEDRLPAMEDRELVATAKLGVAAATQRESLRIRAEEAETAQGILAAMFGGAAGLITDDDVPEAEIIDVTPMSLEEMQDEVRAERAALVRLQAGEAVAG